MKKLSSFIALLLIIIAGVWFYLANEFEKIATEDLLPKIKKNKSLITADLDSVIIEKFKFRLTLKDVTILPKSPHLTLATDTMVASYNPFTDKITICFNGDKLSNGIGKTAVYIPSPNQTITFNKALLKDDIDDIENIDITLTSKEPSMYFTEDDKFIARAADSKLNISSQLDNGAYFINLKLNFNKMEINPESKYMAYMIEKLVPESLRKELNLSDDSYIENYYYKVAEKTGPLDYSTEYSLKINEDSLEDIISTLTDKKELSELYEKFDFKKENYSISIKESFGNSAMKDSGSMHFSGDGKKINSTMDVSFVRNYSDTQKQEITSITRVLLTKLAQQIPNNDLNFSTTEDDFTPLATSITDVKNFKMALDVVYDIESSDFTHSLNIGLDDFNAELNGAVKEKIYDAKTTIDTPTLLINSLTNFYATSIKPILNTGSNEAFQTKIKSLDLIIENIKNNSFDALAALHNGEELKENDILKSNFMFNPHNFDFKINDKGFFDILTDEHVVKFLQGMPEDEDGQEE